MDIDTVSSVIKGSGAVVFGVTVALVLALMAAPDLLAMCGGSAAGLYLYNW